MRRWTFAFLFATGLMNSTSPVQACHACKPISLRCAPKTLAAPCATTISCEVSAPVYEVLVPRTITKHVTVTETVYDDVTESHNVTKYRTEHKTEKQPVTRTEYESLPVTNNVTRYRTEYKTETVPTTSTVFDNVPVTNNVIRYRTEYKTETVPTIKTVFEPVQKTRQLEVKIPVTETFDAKVTKTVYDTVTRNEKRFEPYTEAQTVTEMVMHPETVHVTRKELRTVHVPQQKMVAREVTQCKEMIEDRGCWVNQAVPVQTSAGCTTGCGVSGKCGSCGHLKKSIGCGGCGHVCGGVTYACQQVWVSRPVRTSVPVKVQVQECVTEMVAQQQEVEVPSTETKMVPKEIQRTQHVTKTRETEVPVTHQVPRSVEEVVKGTRVAYR
ncbi:MAG: hypothetical protein NT172_08610, partial [Planctomycetota bacterium]|nr:hypothetical protein [Planctomycetota bacterium]